MKKFTVRVNGNEYEVEVEEIAVSAATATAHTATHARPTPAASPTIKEPPRPAAAAVTGREGAELISAPMPGTILDVRVQAGEKVSKGQTLMILEAMKMENEILAPQDSSVVEIHAIKGNSVNAGDPLIVLA